MARDHRLFRRNGSVLNGHCKVIEAVVPVLKALLNSGVVSKINTAGSQHSRGQRFIKITRTNTGLEVDVRGEGGRQVVYACTSDRDTAEQALRKKFRENIVMST